MFKNLFESLLSLWEIYLGVDVGVLAHSPQQASGLALLRGSLPSQISALTLLCLSAPVSPSRKISSLRSILLPRCCQRSPAPTLTGEPLWLSFTISALCTYGHILSPGRPCQFWLPSLSAPQDHDHSCHGLCTTSGRQCGAVVKGMGSGGRLQGFES